jgi:PAP2 superfamily
MLTTRRALARRRYGLTQIAVVLAAVGVYELARLAMTPNWPQATANARRIVDLENWLSLSWEPAMQEAFLDNVPRLVQGLNVFYFVGHFLFTGIFFVWLYRRSQSGFSVFRDGFLVATAISIFVHWLYPTAPPRLADGDIVDTLQILSGVDIGSPGSTGLSNPVAAVPSLHAGYAIGVGIGVFLFTRHWLVRAVALSYPALVVLTIIVTGNHFIFDAVAGVAVMGIGFGLAAQTRAWLARTAETRPNLAILGLATRGGAVR